MKRTRERVWEHGDLPSYLQNAILDFVSEQVSQAEDDYWKSSKCIDLHSTKKRVLIRVLGPFKQDPRAPGRVHKAPDLHELKIDVFSLFVQDLAVYDAMGGPNSEAQKNDVENRAQSARMLALRILRLAESRLESIKSVGERNA